MNVQEIYISQVLSKLPPGELRHRIALDLRSHIADRVERGQSVEDAIARLGDSGALAESYLSAVPLVPAPHLRRALAKLVDVSLPYAFVAAMALSWFLGFFGSTKSEPLAILCATIVLVGVSLYGVTIMLAESRIGQTFGKRLFGLRVVCESGARISFGQAFLRQLPIFLQIFWIDGLFVLFTDRRQRAFELLSKTRVVVAQESQAAGEVPASTPLPVAP
jgi:uncharacterized RDD family membrane protein YckC